jgi:RNA polymerase sigma-70 factor (ECF subfamily)
VEPAEHLFRRESGRLVAALTRLFGVHNLALAEDVVQEAFCRALEVWKFRGLPENPSAWLMTTAKRRALDVLRRERTARVFGPELGRWIESEWTLAPRVEELLGPAAIQDDVLRMMFSCCQPRLPEAAQVALVLNILCGFSANEIAGAFLSGPAAIEKRIARGKRVLAESKALFDLNASDVAARLPTVHGALYLLFNEGYHGASPEAAVRAHLCQEALRLARTLLAHPATALPATHALCALMCLHAARLPARVNAAGGLTSLFDQDRSQWDAALVAEGLDHLERSASGPALSEYHVEAAIASFHATARRAEDTDWGGIVAHYDLLLALRPSPVVALNRAIAVAQHRGPEAGLAAIRAIDDPGRLAAYPFYSAALGEFELRRGRRDAARRHFQSALKLGRNPMERRYLEQRIAACGSKPAHPPGDRPGEAAARSE